MARTKVTTKTTRNMPRPPRVRVISRPRDSRVLRESCEKILLKREPDDR